MSQESFKNLAPGPKNLPFWWSIDQRSQMRWSIGAMREWNLGRGTIAIFLNMALGLPEKFSSK